MLHPAVRDLSHEKQVSHEEAESLIRGRAKTDPAAKAIVDLIDTARAKEKADALALNKASAKKLGLDLDGAARLVAALAADVKLYTWLCRRVQLTIADERAPINDHHPANQ